LAGCVRKEILALRALVKDDLETAPHWMRDGGTRGKAAREAAKGETPTYLTRPTALHLGMNRATLRAMKGETP